MKQPQQKRATGHDDEWPGRARSDIETMGENTPRLASILKGTLHAHVKDAERRRSLEKRDGSPTPLITNPCKTRPFTGPHRLFISIRRSLLLVDSYHRIRATMAFFYQLSLTSNHIPVVLFMRRLVNLLSSSRGTGWIVGFGPWFAARILTD